MKSSFVLYTDNHSSIELLTIEQKAMLLDLFFLYHKDVDIEITDPVLKMAFSFFERTFERDKIKYDKRVEANKNNGLKGGRPKNPGKPKKPTGLNENPNNPEEPKKADTVTDTVTDTVPVPVNDPDTKEKDLLSDSPESDQKEKPVYPESFEKFWIAYPKKEGKGAAYKSYQKIKPPRPTLKIILDSIEIHKKTNKWQNKQYIPLASTFLNQRRWEDEFSDDDFSIPRNKETQNKLKFNFKG